ERATCEEHQGESTHARSVAHRARFWLIVPPMRNLPLTAVLVTLGLALTSPSTAEPTPPLAPDIPGKFTPPTQSADYERREIMIAMRDGVKLHTVIVVPRGARRAPIMLTRTPYNAGKRAQRTVSTRLAATLPISDDQFAADGNYIRVFQDIRGKYGS